jgi:hypothetical protein
MNKKLISGAVFVFLLLATAISAHELKISGSIGVTLHTDPDDAQVAQQPSKLLITIEDIRHYFTPAACNCTLTIAKNYQFIAAFPLSNISTFSVIPYTFADAGTYALTVTGNAKDGSFGPFTVVFDTYVSADGTAPEPTGPSPLRVWLPLVLLAAVALIVLTFFIKWGDA